MTPPSPLHARPTMTLAPTHLPQTHLEALVAHLARETGPNAMQHDYWMNTLYTATSDHPEASDLYATPGWEGSAGVPWSVITEGGDVEGHGEVKVDWTGDIAADARLYHEVVARLLSDLSASIR